jgi:hypothetical protein
MTRALPDVVGSVVADLMAAGGSGTHVHFDDPQFAGLIPPFEDRGWIELARLIITVASRVSDRILVDVPVGSWQKPPSLEEIAALESLAGWELPGIYLVPEGGTAFDHRTTRGWYSDGAPQVQGAKGWWGGYLDSESREGPEWRISLLYESTAP